MENWNELYNSYENLTQDTLDKLTSHYVDDVFFKDPFNELVGRDKLKKIFIEMFEKLDNPHFVFIDKINTQIQFYIFQYLPTNYSSWWRSRQRVA